MIIIQILNDVIIIIIRIKGNIYLKILNITDIIGCEIVIQDKILGIPTRKIKLIVGWIQVV